MNEFDNNYFDFENTDNFLETISGTLQSLSPSSISDESIKNIASPENLTMDYINYNYNTNNQFDVNLLANQQLSQPAQLNQSVSTYSNDSNNISPISHTSSSPHTSPTITVKKELSTEEEDEEDDDDTKTKTKSKKLNSKLVKPKKDKNSHNMIEKKYRTNINSKILALRDAVPSLRIAAGSKDISVADLEGLTPASKLNKASVLTKATEYIKHLENKNSILKQQNYQLQTLINQANLNPQQIINLNLNSMNTDNTQQQHGFGFYPQENFNVTYNQQPVSYTNTDTSQMSNNIYSVPQTTSNQSITNKVLLGGMAAVMGTSLFANGGNDMKGLSGLPFSFLLPRMVTNPSPITIQLFELIKMLLLLGSLFTLIWPLFKPKNSDIKSGTINDNVFKTWVLVNMGLKLPKLINDSEIQQIVNRLIGGNPSIYQLIKDYVLLSSSSATFETCLLNLIISKILIKKHPMISYIIQNNLTIKGGLILNFEYRGDNKSLIQLNKLIGKVDGLSFFGSDELFSRIINLAENKPINYSINDGQNHLKYVEIFNLNKQDYYGILFNWRVLEIIHELNMKYLELDDDENKTIENDLDIINETLDKDSYIYQYFNLFKTVVNCNNSSNLLKVLQNRVEKCLKNFDLITNGQELTDDDKISEDEEESNKELEKQERKSTESNIEKQSVKKLVSSLNLINQEEFIILTSSMILYYYKSNKIDQAIKSLNYLSRLSKKKTLTLLSFTSLINLLEIIPKIDDNKILDNMIIILRQWLNSSNLNNFMDFSTKSNLTKLVVNKGMLLNGIEINETEED